MKYSPHSRRQIAASVLEVLNELIGEIHAGRMVAVLAEKSPEIFETKRPGLITRIGEGAVFLALSKFADLWDSQILPLLQNRAPRRGRELRNEIKRKKVVQFRNLFVAHYSDRKENLKPGFERFAKLLNALGFYDAQTLALWTVDVLATIEEIREVIYSEFSPEDKMVVS
jgi:hypothetical protein